MRRTFSALLPLLLVSSVAVGCQGFPLTGLGTGGVKYGALAFGPVSDANKSLLAQGESRQTSGTAAPMAAGADAASATRPAIAPMPMIAPVGYWPGGDYDLLETSEAKAAGFTGTFAEALDKHIRPIVGDWSGDASLRSAGGLADTKGANPVLSGDVSPYSWQGWRFTFFSPAKMESLSFLVTSNQTLVLKQRFKSRNVDILAPKLGSAEVIAIVAKAIADKNAVAFDPEANQASGGGSVGVGVAYPTVAVNPTMTAPMPPGGLPTPVTVDGSPVPDAYKPPVEEILYAVPDNARWDLNLYPEKNRLVWNVSLQVNQDSNTAVSSDMAITKPKPGVSTGATTTVTAPSVGYGYGGGWARVDANTGALLSLERPRKITFYNGGRPSIEPMPAPMPADKPTATSGSAGAAAAL